MSQDSYKLNVGGHVQMRITGVAQKRKKVAQQQRMRGKDEGCAKNTEGDL